MIPTSAVESTVATTQSSTTVSTSSGAPSIAELRKILPDVDAAGGDFKAVDVAADPSEGSDDDTLAKAMAEGCPPSKKLMDTETGDPSTYAGRLFNADDNRQIGVFLLLADDPRTGFSDKAGLDELLDAIAQCRQITATDQGMNYKADLHASPSDAFGSYGATVGADLELTGGPFKSPVAIHMDISLFRVGDVDVMVQSTSGIAPDGTESPTDPSVAKQIATGLEQRLIKFQATH